MFISWPQFRLVQFQRYLNQKTSLDRVRKDVPSQLQILRVPLPLFRKMTLQWTNKFKDNLFLLYKYDLTKL